MLRERTGSPSWSSESYSDKALERSEFERFRWGDALLCLDLALVDVIEPLERRVLVSSLSASFDDAKAGIVGINSGSEGEVASASVGVGFDRLVGATIL